ncbi:ribonuclease H-like domain-containing protein [Paraburkholderia sabiae]|uniref:Ribonuclease H-like domain-containing protein n=1 Tax=Paraburkholderia sabiae TaxID=273251 RepID=A0ABU9QQX2_9BURK|nr:ribonuclease H-like domain-containing protein [Paraburkholderia sabiae]WJZ74381.1 ribonuclease H-like domain-containing protein [Paraburkholderia sabiae]CAD6562657.1 hypothetical protein LMG24235_07896 [Paraburkholderia sabiae]
MLSKTQHLVAHNGNGFDFPFITREFQRIGVPVPTFGPIDAMQEARWATPLGKLERKSTSTCELAALCHDIPRGSALHCLDPPAGAPMGT